MISSVQFSSIFQSWPTLQPYGLQLVRLLGVHHQFLEFAQFMFIESVMPSKHFILCCPLLFLPSIFPSIGVFTNESARIRWPKYWSFNFSISPSKEYSGLISFRINWLALLEVQGNLKSLLQQYSSKASILHCQPSLWSNSNIHTWLLEKP